MKYTITDNDLALITDFAEKSYKMHRSNGRSDKQVFQDIVVGKLGELAYKRIVGDSIDDINLVVYEDPDPGWDFVSKSGDRIQVKTIQPNFHWVSFGNYYWDRLVIIQMDGRLCTLLRDMHITEVKDLAQKSKFKGWYIPSYKI